MFFFKSDFHCGVTFNGGDINILEQQEQWLAVDNSYNGKNNSPISCAFSQKTILIASRKHQLAIDLFFG